MTAAAIKAQGLPMACSLPGAGAMPAGAVAGGITMLTVLSNARRPAR